MRASHLFSQTSKTSQADNDSVNADLLTRAGYIHKTLAGSYSFLPLGLRVIRNIENIVREEMNGVGGQEILMSALASKEAWEATNRWDTLDVLFKVPAAGNSEYALNPTHEEVVTPVAKSFINSYRDLPFAAYQIQTKFRNEPRAKSGVMRGREFIMKDLYSFHVDQTDLDQYYDKVAEAYTRVFERLGLGEKTYFTYASGGSFSKYSHEYQTLLPSGEDTIYISVEAEKQGKKIAVNKEIFEEGMNCPELDMPTEWREEAASEVGNIFKLSTKFSEPFKLDYLDEAGERKPVVMGCYGIGISRLMGVIAEYDADDKGLAWPASVAPFAVHLITLGKGGEEARDTAEQIYTELTEAGVEVLFDDREKARPGEKFGDAELIGCPTRVVISGKSLEAGGAEVVDRKTGESEIIALENISKTLSK